MKQLAFALMLASCAHSSVWIVSQDSDGGVIGFRASHTSGAENSLRYNRDRAVESICGERDAEVIKTEVIRPTPAPSNDETGKYVKSTRSQSEFMPQDTTPREIPEYTRLQIRCVNTQTAKN